MTAKAARVVWRFIFGMRPPEPATDELTAEECAELAGALMEHTEVVQDDPDSLADADSTDS